MRDLDIVHLQCIQVVNNITQIKPYKFLAEFAKNKHDMSSHEFKQTHKIITDELNRQNINYAFLMLTQVTYVFTEQKINLDKIMFKLMSGINFNSEPVMPDMATSGIIDQVNRYFGR